MRALLVKLVFLVLPLCFGQIDLTLSSTDTSLLHNGLTEKIGNFSLELLYFTSKNQEHSGSNFIMSPITVWTALAVIAEGASDFTLAQLNNALRITKRSRDNDRRHFGDIAQWLRVNTNTIELSKFNALFIDNDTQPQSDFQVIAKNYYEVNMISVNFRDPDATANLLNTAISRVTHGRISNIVDSSYFKSTKMVLMSALYFKGQWTVPFNASSTMMRPFFSSAGDKIGDVNMMYNKYTYPFANVKELQARVLELPYGKENRLSMIVMLPHPRVSLENMFLNFMNVTLDTLFKELRVAKEEFGEDEVDCLIPRFKIESYLDLTQSLKNDFGIEDLFDQTRARLPNLARKELFLSKVFHKAEIEVTEEGTTASGVTVAEFTNRMGTLKFEANRPFAYMIIEKVTNSIVFGGLYMQPVLY